MATTSISPEQSSEQTPRSRKSSDNTSATNGNSAWIDVHYDPVASLYTFSRCMALEDLANDGDHKLLVGDLGSGQYDMKLKVFKGTEQTQESPLMEMPTGVCTFYMDTTDPRTPAVAVSCGSFIYVFKNLRPYFKFTLPLLELNSTEVDLWNQVKEDKIDPAIMRESLESMNNDGTDIPLTVRSLKFLQLDTEDLLPFAAVFKHIPLKRQTIITCMTTLKKSHEEADAVSCIVVGTENKDIYILDPEAFTVLKKLILPAVPVFISATGLYDVEYYVSVACRDACVYTLKTGGHTPKYKIPLGSQPCGLQRMDKNIFIGCMDNTLACYSTKGKRLWLHNLPAAITALELLDHRPRGIKGVIIALKNREVRFYRDKYLVNTITLEDVVVGLKFGPFGREEGALLMVTQGGALIVKMLKRTASLEAKDPNPGPPKGQLGKLNVPKKTKVFVDQTIRERENAIAMHNTFQRDLSRLKLEVARAYAKVVSSSLAPVINSKDVSVKISAHVQGLGPLFQLTFTVQNTAPSAVLTNLCITFKCDESLYRIYKKLIQLPLLVPSLEYNFETRVECLDEVGRTENISVFVMRKGNPAPLISALIKMPVSESVIVV